MFLKLFKHAFCKNMKTSIILLSISVAMSLFSGILYRVSWKLPDNQYLESLVGSLLGFSSFITYVLCSIPVILVYHSFHKAVATDEAYLTFTLPIKPSQLINARILAVVCWSLITSAVAVISLGISSTLSGGLGFNGSLDLSGIEPSGILLILELIIFVIAFDLSSIVHILFAIVLNGALSTKIKSRGSVILVVLLLYAEIAIVTTVSVIIAIFLFDTISKSIFALHLLAWYGIILVSGLGVLTYFLSKKMLTRGLNLA